MGALTKAELADRLFDEMGLNKREAKELVDLFFEELRAALERNESVKLSGSEISICVIREKDPVGIQELAKRYLLHHVG